MKFPLKNPSPNFQALEEILKGQREPDKVHFVELWIDFEIIEFISNKLMVKKLPNFGKIKQKKMDKFTKGEEVNLLTTEEDKNLVKGYIDFYYHMGYDCIPDFLPIIYQREMIITAIPKVRQTEDTAVLAHPKGKRVWAEEGKAAITSWEDFEKFPWKRIKLGLEDYYAFVSENLPEGIKLVVLNSVFEQILEWLLGYENLFYLLYDQPDLVREVFNKWGQIVYEFYKSVISLDCVGAIFHGDDLAYKTSTIVSPKILRQLVFPWFKKYASLAHKYKKMYWYHCCGDASKIMEDLIEDVKIDAYHSFEDVIEPVTEFKKKYEDRIATLGGVDMDKLCRLEEKELRKYVRSILDKCMHSGRYALGSGNSIANYVPVQNYLTMLDEGTKWRV